MTSTTKVLIGIVGAAAAGVVIGMMLAPEKGSDLRKKVKEAANDWANQLADMFAEGKAEFSNLKSKASRAAKDFQSKAEDKFAGVRENLG